MQDVESEMALDKFNVVESSNYLDLESDTSEPVTSRTIRRKSRQIDRADLNAGEDSAGDSETDNSAPEVVATVSGVAAQATDVADSV